ncbi:MAG: hypothetical protein IJB26_03565 [Clostridia bacterium]|nr:hypothetical protein [Clostridia bacterium]
MRVLENGVYRDMTAEELERETNAPQPSFKERVIARVRAVYSVDDELAILRQRDAKPQEFAEYNALVERIKEEERG